MLPRPQKRRPRLGLEGVPSGTVVLMSFSIRACRLWFRLSSWSKAGLGQALRLRRRPQAAAPTAVVTSSAREKCLRCCGASV